MNLIRFFQLRSPFPINFSFKSFEKYRLTSITCLLFPLIMVQNCYAALGGSEKWYEIEVIVFANKQEGNEELENWTKNPGVPDLNNAVHLISEWELLLDDEIEKLPIYYLEPPELGEDNLSGFSRKLNLSPRYDLLLHRSWHQIVPTNSSGIAVSLNDKDSNDLYQPIDTSFAIDVIEEEKTDEQLLMEALLAEENLTEAMMNSEAQAGISEFDPIERLEDMGIEPSKKPINFGPMGPPHHKVFGTIKLFKSRYLHMAIDFIYRGDPIPTKIVEVPMEDMFPMASVGDNGQDIIEEPVFISEPASALIEQDQTPLVGYRLRDSKRVRLKRVYYFDHPMFGVIARVISYTPPVEEAEDENSEIDASLISRN